MIKTVFRCIMNETEIRLKLSKVIKEKAIADSNEKNNLKTNAGLAGAIDVDESTVRRIYKGEQNISLKVIISICNAFDIKISDLFLEIGE